MARHGDVKILATERERKRDSFAFFNETTWRRGKLVEGRRIIFTLHFRKNNNGEFLSMVYD